MGERLRDAVSPYLRAHADNPVDWYPWGEAAFAEAARRGVPVLVSIGYSTCHWCHVMSRESFSDPAIAAILDDGFVAVKVDREEHPEVDASYLAAASAFTGNLGWPLNVFTTPDGKPFYAGTYSPPVPLQGHPSFRQVLAAVTEAWTDRRDDVLESAAGLASALASATGTSAGKLPDRAALDAAVASLERLEDPTYGGFGTAPKFPIAPVLGFLVTPLPEPSAEQAGPPRGASPAESLALRTLRTMGASALRDPVEGGFFRYSVQQDWSEPHYERMLYDNALLLDAYTRAWTIHPQSWASLVAEGVADFLTVVLQQPSGGFASAQDSESMIDGERSEGGYYRLDRFERARQTPPATDRKVLTGWNGLAIEALARAGFVFDRPEWIEAARWAADAIVGTHLLADGTLIRASLEERLSDASAALEDYGMLASGLLELASVTGEPEYARVGRRLVDECLVGGGAAGGGASDAGDANADGAAGAAGAADAGPRFALPGGGDRVLAAQGLRIDVDPSEGAYPSGPTSLATAAHRLFLLTGDRRYHDAASVVVAAVADRALAQPTAFGATLALAARLVAEPTQLVVVTPDAEPTLAVRALVDAVRTRRDDVVAVVTEVQAAAWAEAGFELLAGRTSRDGLATAYVCRDFVCRLPTTEVAALAG
ncbi:thioredoxin domain-containing protein [Plantibacter sp. YIM 135347]|uniref:thioredoxin domain-containing protein n=1 Tax=Plantibacter sp. YIM 135347 TaxID=3423919 RepID=UPI003D3352AF